MYSFVLTPLTQTAIAVLYEIANGGSFNYLKNGGDSTSSLPDIVLKLQSKNIIRLKEGCTDGDLSCFELTQPVFLITLLDIIEAIGEGIDYDNLIPEVTSHLKGVAMVSPEVVKRIIHAYFETIKLANLGKKQCTINQLSVHEK